jgi:uncharacterized protein (DUF1330 family)
MPSYAVAHMRQVTMGPAVVEYLQRIDATLAPFGGRFIVHGGEVEVLEGRWPGHLIVIEFPDAAGPAPGTTQAPTRRSLRCARTTPKATSSWSTGWAASTRPPMYSRRRESGDRGLRV